MADVRKPCRSCSIVSKLPDGTIDKLERCPDPNRISMDPRYDVWCPKCYAAIGAPCTERTKDGRKFVSHIHEAREVKGESIAS